MRPSSLAPLFAGLRGLEGIGPRLESLLARLLKSVPEGSGPRVVDLLLHFPTGLIDRSARPRIADATPGAVVTLDVSVRRHLPPPGRGGRIPYRIICEDDSGAIELIFFRADTSYLQRILPEGERRLVSGRIDAFSGRLQMPHPDYVVSAEEFDALPKIEPVYPLTAGLSGKVLRRALKQALGRVDTLAEWQDSSWLAARSWPDFTDALRQVHGPRSQEDLLHGAPARQRLAFDELLANQLALALVRGRLRKSPGRALTACGRMRTALLKSLPFALTPSQEEAIAEIDADLAAPHRMLRLLQGDVGSGKTAVALLAMATAIEAGSQAALMAPTEVLARQHAATLAPIAESAGIRMALLTGREKGRERAQVLEDLGSGVIDLLVGTHALFQETVAFKDLGLAIIDEQHRFGVHQRLALQAKGSQSGADVLVMTATPIPRTLLLTHYGDMSVSRLREKPPGRTAVTTRAMPRDRLNEVAARLAAAVAEGAQVYWVCPLVEESDKLDVVAAEERHAHLQTHFGDKVGLIHGRLPAREKDRVMTAFAAGELSVLVATTVVEVGIDVPNASIMVIEHAERFGLAQLHQLRGRVGRGIRDSSCILIYQPPLSETARARLKIMRETEDGFRIAEEDLKLRGGGEVLGTRQSGLPEFRAARLPEDEELLMAARDDAKLILARDPALESARGEALRVLLYLFERDEALRLLRAG